MDPSQGGGAPPPDPSQGGGAPPPGGGGGGLDPNQPIQMSLNDLLQFVQMMQGGAGGTPPAQDPSGGGAPNEPSKPKGSAGKKGEALEGKVDEILNLFKQYIAAQTGQVAGIGGGGGGAGGGAPPGADLGLSAPPPMGGPTDQQPTTPMLPGAPAGAPPGVGGPGAPGMTVQAAANGQVKRAHTLNRILKNLRR